MLHVAYSKPHNLNNFLVEEDRLDLWLHIHPEEGVPSTLYHHGNLFA